MPEDEAPYVPASRPYRKRFPYEYRRHAFDKLRAIDLPLREFQVLLDGGEVIAEAEVGILAHKDWCCSYSGGSLSTSRSSSTRSERKNES